jgi:hypothetical protein
MKPVFHIVLQKTDWDCGIAALASLIGQQYAEVLRVAASKYPVERGLFSQEIINVAEAFDVELKRRMRKIDLEDHTGILGVKFPHHVNTTHAVLLANGMVFDPDEDGTIWDAETYIAVKKATVLDLLEEVE